MSNVLTSEITWDADIEGVDATFVSRRIDRQGRHLPVVIFDGDDTLWATEHLYDDARKSAADVVESAGLPRNEWWREQLDVDVKNVSRFGLSAERFPTSCVEAYRNVAARNGAETQSDIADRVWRAGASVFEAKAPVNAAAQGVMRKLRPEFRLVLLTQGDPRVQRKRVNDSGLAELFDEILIVARKSPAVLAAILDELSIPHNRCWMVGNSVPSDINPAVAVGMRAIWIDAHVWQHERREDLVAGEGVTIASNLKDVPSIIA